MTYLLLIKTREGYSFKVLAELLQNCIKDGCFVVSKKGIELIGKDSKTKSGTKLVSLEMPRKNFIKYTCPDSPMKIGLNLSHFYKMLKSIKKKDTLTLFIEEDNPLNLGIEIHQNGDNNSTKSYVRITQVHPVQYDPLEGYDDPIITTSKEFSKLKQLNKISKTLLVTAGKQWIEFFGDKEDMYARKVRFGEEEDDEKVAEDIEHIDEEGYKQTYAAEDVIQLVKIGGLSNTIQIYATNDLPLKFTLNTGSLGTLSIYIKSKEEIESEQEEESQTTA